MGKIFFPLNYFRLENDEKRIIDLWPTIILAALVCVPFFVFSSANFFGVGGFASSLIVLTAALTGFYVAALVAASTFDRPDLDKVIEVGPVYLSRKDADGTRYRDSLTRREFATMMFGFLAFSAMGFTIVTAALIPIAAVAPTSIGQVPYLGWDWHEVLSVVAKLIVAAWISHIFVVTCLGLYYLMDRLYHRNPEVVSTKK